jgi:N-acetylglutamate synthase-like GNAT family acetyltransferase
MQTSEWARGEYLISTDKSKIDVTVVHQFLSQSYWAKGISQSIMQKSIENSLCFAVYHKQVLVGFARVISDFATFSYLADVFIVPEERGKGLSKWLMQVIMNHPGLQGLRRFLLATRDAHSLYAQFGFTALDKPERWMQKHDPDVYTRQ